MDKMVIKARVERFGETYAVLPATAADKRILDTFIGEMGGQYISINAHRRKGTKTYNQVKTVWALIDMMCEAVNGAKPTKADTELMYMDMLDLYADKLPSPKDPERFVPVSLSMMSVQQAAGFIQSLINELATTLELTDVIQSDLKGIFESFTEWKGRMENDPCDYNPDGELLTTAEWIEKNPVSHASGLATNLEIAHIVSKGTAPQFRDCCWNFLRLTHDEHIGIQHKRGWNEFLSIYPHLRPRVERARDIAKKLELIESENMKEEYDIY